jgi:hypothetical protein
MSDSAKAFVVVLDEDLSEENSEQTKKALLHFRGVISVEPHVHDIADVIAEARARHKLATSIYEFLRDWK